MYICLDGCKNGFRAGCRPLIGLDGAFLKTRFSGQILAAIYVIAYAIVPVENTDNWRWFLELLHDDLGSYTQNGCCFISDMQKVTTNLIFTSYCFHDSDSNNTGFFQTLLLSCFAFMILFQYACINIMR